MLNYAQNVHVFSEAIPVISSVKGSHGWPGNIPQYTGVKKDYTDHLNCLMLQWYSFTQGNKLN